MARPAATEVEVQEDNKVSRIKRVIIQRPAGNTDSHQFLAFNDFEGHFPYDEPVELPSNLVDYIRSQRKPEFHPTEKGDVGVNRVNVLNLVDA